ncbi:MAG: hypothetical protein IJ615_11660 [Bacteroidaceae bacterium]|nr:hypothetical protein [Bacteroidaceae bacterium]
MKEEETTLEGTGKKSPAKGDSEGLSLEEQVERIRRKRARSHDYSRARMVLNALFLALAAVGLGMYFFGSADHVPALCVIAAGMVLKVVEFILRIL